MMRAHLARAAQGVLLAVRAINVVGALICAPSALWGTLVLQGPLAAFGLFVLLSLAFKFGPPAAFGVALYVIVGTDVDRWFWLFTTYLVFEFAALAVAAIAQWLTPAPPALDDAAV